MREELLPDSIFTEVAMTHSLRNVLLPVGPRLGHHACGRGFVLGLTLLLIAASPLAAAAHCCHDERDLGAHQQSNGPRGLRGADSRIYDDEGDDAPSQDGGLGNGRIGESRNQGIGSMQGGSIGAYGAGSPVGTAAGTGGGGLGGMRNGGIGPAPTPPPGR
jgi:hypothetical protein